MFLHIYIIIHQGKFPALCSELLLFLDFLSASWRPYSLVRMKLGWQALLRKTNPRMYNGSNVAEMYFLCMQAHVLKIIAILPGVTPGLRSFFPVVLPSSTGRVHIPINPVEGERAQRIMHKRFWWMGLGSCTCHFHSHSIDQNIVMWLNLAAGLTGKYTLVLCSGRKGNGIDE